MTALLALFSSVVWGTADFLGGTVSRRVHPVAVVGASQCASLLLVIPLVLVTGAYSADRGYLLWGISAGLVGMVSLIAFYQALAIGLMGVVAPISSTGAMVPVVIGLIEGERPTALQLSGIAVAIVGVVLASGPELRPGTRDGSAGGRSVLLALVAAVGFGTVLWLVAKGSRYSVAMTLLSQRLSSVLVLLVALAFVRKVGGLKRSDLWIVALVGAGDVSANGLFAIASQSGLVSLVAVLASLYPVTTVVLARIFHGERMRPIQNAGVALALVGVALIGAAGL